MPNFLIDEDTDLLAAEFVLGTLDSEERANAQSLLRMDHGFIAMVRIWERRFGELHLMVEPVEPDAKILQRIKAKIAEISASEPVPAGKPPAEGAPSLEPPEATGSSADMPKPADALASGQTLPQDKDDPAAPEPQEVPASGISATGETGKPAETSPAPDAPAAAEVRPSPESGPAPPPPLKLPDKLPAKDQRPEITIKVIRSRGRWRFFAVCMTLLVMGLVALLAAWRFAPDRLPAGLRPAELLLSVGIRTLPKAAPAVKPAQPQFDE